jgi:UDP:flavonoid glycosyltransferase YjiC (YdhE family)
MRIGMQGWGSEGDLRPMLAFAARLREQGHVPRLVLTSVDGVDYATSAEPLGIACQLVPGQLPVTLQELARDARHGNPTKLMHALLARTFYPFLEESYAAALALCAQSDVVIGGSSSWVLKAAAEVARVPFVSLHYYPGVVPSRIVPPAIFPNWRWLARPGWALLSLLMDLALAGPARKFFARKGLTSMRHVIPDLLFSARLNLLAASPSFFPPAPDWSGAFRVTGELRAPALARWRPSTELSDFLARGEKPILMSLGSMEHMAPARSRELLIASARAAGVRAIIQSKSAHGEGQDRDLYFLRWAPHERLAPLCSAFVHHGGAGTSHAALRAGLPSLVLPFIFEQGLWAKQLRRVGAAPKARSFWSARPAQVAGLIREALTTEKLRARANQLARALDSEDGALTATRHLERLLNCPR